LLQTPGQRAPIAIPGDVLDWLKMADSLETQIMTATFIIDVDEQLWIADRRSEHVVCARSQEVLAAGEITFQIADGQIEVTEVTNQSTGYCPEPECWPVVSAILDRIGLAHPPAFTIEFVFRRCDQCGTINIVKDGVFECAVCQSVLSLEWNFAKAPHKRYL
jgi:hypothetical protein